MNKFETCYVVGIYNTEDNQCYYLHAQHFTLNFHGRVKDAKIFSADSANHIVECNEHPREDRPLVDKRALRYTRLFVSKVFRNKKTGVLKLTKMNAFQLMEHVLEEL